MADIDPINTQPLSDDQELAKVLAGVSQQADDGATDDTTARAVVPLVPQMDDEVTAASSPDDTVASDAPVSPVSTLPPETDTPVTPISEPTIEPMSDTSVTPSFSMPATSAGGELDSIKKEALGELRPLVDKLNVAPEEKFDTYLLLLRSTDDKALIGPAHEAAKNIPDETRRAQALLDIIKEIDFLSQNGQ